jgi:hypothetical protein
MLRFSWGLTVMVGMGCMGVSSGVLAQEPKSIQVTSERCQEICLTPRDEFTEAISSAYRQCISRGLCPIVKAPPVVFVPRVRMAQ